MSADKEMANVLTVTPKEEEQLAEYSRSQDKHLATRAKIVLCVARGASVSEAVRQLATSRQKVGKRVKRYRSVGLAIFNENRHGVPHRFSKISSSAIEALRTISAQRTLTCKEAAQILGVSPASACRWKDLLDPRKRLVGKYKTYETTVIAPSRKQLAQPYLAERLNGLVDRLVLEQAVRTIYVAQLRTEVFAPMIRLYRKLFQSASSEQLEHSLHTLPEPIPSQVTTRKARHLRLYKSEALKSDLLERNFIAAILGAPGPRFALITPIKSKPNPLKTCKSGSLSGAVLTIVVGDQQFPALWRSVASDQNSSNAYGKLVVQLEQILSKQTSEPIPTIVDLPDFPASSRSVLRADWFGQLSLPTIIGGCGNNVALAIPMANSPSDSKVISLTKLNEAMDFERPHAVGIRNERGVTTRDMNIWRIPLNSPNPPINSCLAVRTNKRLFFLACGTPDFGASNLAPLVACRDKNQQSFELMNRYVGLKNGHYVSGLAWEKRKLVASLSWWLCQQLRLLEPMRKRVKR